VYRFVQNSTLKNVVVNYCIPKLPMSKGSILVAVAATCTNSSQCTTDKISAAIKSANDATFNDTVTGDVAGRS
jgi:hypothetical protein